METHSSLTLQGFGFMCAGVPTSCGLICSELLKRRKWSVIKVLGGNISTVISHKDFTTLIARNCCKSESTLGVLDL